MRFVHHSSNKKVNTKNPFEPKIQYEHSISKALKYTPISHGFSPASSGGQCTAAGQTIALHKAGTLNGGCKFFFVC